MNIVIYLFVINVTLIRNLLNVINTSNVTNKYIKYYIKLYSINRSVNEDSPPVGRKNKQDKIGKAAKSFLSFFKKGDIPDLKIGQFIIFYFIIFLKKFLIFFFIFYFLFFIFILFFFIIFIIFFHFIFFG